MKKPPKEGMTCDRCKKVVPALCFSGGEQVCMGCLENNNKEK